MQAVGTLELASNTGSSHIILLIAFGKLAPAGHGFDSVADCS
jgi:hypothetical protein